MRQTVIDRERDTKTAGHLTEQARKPSAHKNECVVAMTSQDKIRIENPYLLTFGREIEYWLAFSLGRLCQIWVTRDGSLAYPGSPDASPGSWSGSRVQGLLRRNITSRFRRNMTILITTKYVYEE